MKKFTFFLLLCLCTQAHAQDNPFIRLVELTKEKNTVSTSRQFIIGSTCKTCLLTINDNAVRVYKTGAFAFELNLNPGDTSFLLTATNTAGKTSTKTMGFSYTLPKPIEAVKSLSIESIQTFPAGNLVLMAGDKIQFKVKAFPSSNVSTINGTVLYEMPTSATQGMKGIYQGEYIVNSNTMGWKPIG
jgi:N-acetylmuramoyl-L-alanine amidase